MKINHQKLAVCTFYFFITDFFLDPKLTLISEFGNCFVWETQKWQNNFLALFDILSWGYTVWSLFLSKYVAHIKKKAITDVF